MSFILAIDQGTSSSRALIFDQSGQRKALSQHSFKQYYPQSGWVEHDPEEIWQTTLTSCREAIAQLGIKASQIATIGITNQRETLVLWDKTTGEPVYNALVWQDRRTADFCNNLKQLGIEQAIQQRTGLLLDPYFSASKIRWLLNNIGGLRQRAEAGEIAFGTIDSFLLWRLTGGKSHLTDATNASRTQLYNIHTNAWDPWLLEQFQIPDAILPKVCDNCAEFGVTDPDLLGAKIPINALIGDQQAALVGQACFEPGSAKATYGTGCFVMLNTGDQPVTSSCRLLTTIGYRLKGKTTYALEGSIFNAGTVIQWLRDELGLIEQAKDCEAIAANTTMQSGVYLIPAFTGLGAPYWQPNVRGSIVGINRNTNKNQFITAGLLSIIYQTKDLLNAISSDVEPLTNLKIDGGMSHNNWLQQSLADYLNIPISRPKETETTALGAACLAGLSAGLFESLEQIQTLWQVDRICNPNQTEQHNQDYQGWQDAIAHLLKK